MKSLLNSLMIVAALGFSSLDCYSMTNAENETSCDGCTSIILTLNDNLDTATLDEISDFLNCFDGRCNGSSETTSFANEVLYAILLNSQKCGLIVESLEKSKSEKILVSVLEELESPAYDGIDIASAIVNVKKLPEGTVKARVLKSLDTAYFMSKGGLK